MRLPLQQTTQLSGFYSQRNHTQPATLLSEETALWAQKEQCTIKHAALVPGDPLFFLHHTNLDRLWWEWQAINLTSRLYDIAGNNSPRASFIDTFDLGYPTAAWYDYDGNSGGNVTTLNHTLSVLELWPNATAKDVMDIKVGYLCYEYV